MAQELRPIRNTWYIFYTDTKKDTPKGNPVFLTANNEADVEFAAGVTNAYTLFDAFNAEWVTKLGQQALINTLATPSFNASENYWEPQPTEVPVPDTTP